MTDPLHTEPVEVRAEEVATDRADWLLDAVACATQDRRFLRGDPEYDEVAGEAILLNGKKAILVALSRTAAEAASRQEVERLREALARLREALAETREMLGLCEQIICDETCPTTWRTADGQPHGQMHKDICDVLARHEHHIHPARSALTASEAPDA